MRRACLLLSATLLFSGLHAETEKSEKSGDEKLVEEFESKRLNDFGDYYDPPLYPPQQYGPSSAFRQSMQFHRFPAPNYGQRQQQNFESYNVERPYVNPEENSQPEYGQQQAYQRPIQTENSFYVENYSNEDSNRPYNVGAPRRMPPYDQMMRSVPQATNGMYQSNRGYSYMGYIEKQVRLYPIMIYTLIQCVPCQRAKHMLAVSYPDVRSHFLEITGNEDWQRQLQVDLHHMTGAVTFPYIFVCGSYIGGGSDLMQLHQTGQLRQMVNACSRK
ncbi:hypothetical protein L596_009414 [Steinernema carpocapsae]|uniref:Glutaredoxin domain-containing protein n=1 Tax=Steinernema carpocapsae TaxID=34508 RepID=A0A4U5PF99_STECR|nr:hypothetical protein L596_009414 [Steinernema carpocapsae]